MTTIAPIPRTAHWICGPTVANGVAGGQVAADRRRRVDHQDADRRRARPRRPGSRSRAGGAPAGGPRRPSAGPAARFAVRRASAAAWDASRLARCRPNRGERWREVHRSLRGFALGGQLGDGRLEGRPAGGVVSEHVEARGGRAEQDGRRRRRPGRVCPRRGERLASQRVGGRDGLLERRRDLDPARPAARNRRARSGPLSPIRTAATARSATTAAEARQVDALVTAAGDEHDRCRERSQRRDDRVGLGALRVVDEADAVDERHRLEAVLDAAEGRAPRARMAVGRDPEQQPDRDRGQGVARRCARPGSRARRPA